MGKSKLKDKLWYSPRLRQLYYDLPVPKSVIVLARLSRIPRWSVKYLLPDHFFIDTVDIVITTKCNLMCKGCHHLMPYYPHPYHMDKDRLIAAMRKLNETFDWCDHYNLLGGEPFLNPDLKCYLEEAPSEKCNKVQITTNATIVPDDPELFEVMRRKKAIVLLSQYPANQETQKKLIAVLEREGIAYVMHSPPWTEYGEPVDSHRSGRELKRQFHWCPTRCKQLYDGKIYYCFRSSNTNDLGVCTAGEDEFVDLLHNTKEENRRQIRRLMWRTKPVEACKYCLRGTDENVKISRGAQREKRG